MLDLGQRHKEQKERVINNDDLASRTPPEKESSTVVTPTGNQELMSSCLVLRCGRRFSFRMG
jgi:hypothetical protein